MADSVLERQQTMSEEESEHRRNMAANMRLLLGEERKEETPSGAYEYRTLRSDRVPAYQMPEQKEEYHEPVVPTAPDSPAARRLADFVPITYGMQEVRRMGDMPSAPTYRDYAPPAPNLNRGLFENYLYRDGKLIDTTPAPAPVSDAAVEAPAELPVPEITEEDVRPTPATMGTLNHAEHAAEPNTGLLSALSTRTKLVLAAVAAVIVLLLAVVCVNTAIINSIDADVAAREERLAELTDTLDGIDAEIERLTAPDYIDNWAVEHGMSK